MEVPFIADFRIIKYFVSVM